MKLYQKLAQTLDAQLRCTENKNSEWIDKHQQTLDELIAEHMPHGSGIDSGVVLTDKSSGEYLSFTSSYHCMDENGYYDGWVDFRVIVTPSLLFDFNMKIVGKFGKYKESLPDYLFDLFHYALDKEIL